MEEIKTQAIVLKAIDYKEGGKLLTLFSLERGLIYAKIRGVSKPNAKLAFAAQPFCFGEYILASKVGFTVTNCTSIESFYSLTADFDKFVSASGILEMINILAREEEPNPTLFLATLKALKVLEFELAQPLAVFIKFFIFAMDNAGYRMKLDACPVCGNASPIKEKFSFRRGARMCAMCADNDSIFLSAGEVMVLKNINATPIEKLTTLKFASLDNVVTVVKILLRYFEEKTGEQIRGIKDYL